VKRPDALVGFATSAAVAFGACTSQTSVRTTRDRAVVRSCIDLAQVRTELENSAGETDLKRQTEELGGNVLLIYNVHTGGAFYCGQLPPDVPAPAQPSGANPTPRVR
jgi:hypothetical protein